MKSWSVSYLLWVFNWRSFQLKTQLFRHSGHWWFYIYSRFSSSGRSILKPNCCICLVYFLLYVIWRHLPQNAVHDGQFYIIHSKKGLISFLVEQLPSSVPTFLSVCDVAQGAPDTSRWIWGADGQICWCIHMSSVWEMWLLLTACLFSFHLAGANPWAPPQCKAATMQAVKHTA